MKAPYIISAGIVFLLATSINSVEAQNRSRRQQDKKVEHSDHREERNRKDHNRKYEKHHKHHHGDKRSKHRHYVSRDQHYSCKHNCNAAYCIHQNRNHNTNNYTHHHPEVHARHYVQRLPSHRYFSFYQGDEIYYHCQGRFYSYHTGRGYININLRVLSVNEVPRHYSIREVNGYAYAYCKGYYYIPHAHGYYRVSTSRQKYSTCRVSY
ncbi:hypothetical protein [Carboxylicivirga sp. N1Y90]|uniref:hypothetical protein n=1 Tax=Carboxylicivirga fragile TaxID=3417571 RepID=UPI003D34B3FB|nr:hypothetical protein [Marinilabiliaceae bacterium N1Y90]